MTALIERLRTDKDQMLWAAQRREAADEIERLHAIILTAANNLDSMGAHHYAGWCRLSLEEGK